MASPILHGFHSGYSKDTSYKQPASSSCGGHGVQGVAVRAQRKKYYNTRRFRRMYEKLLGLGTYGQ